MNWSDTYTSQELFSASEQVREAQKNLEKHIHQEIDRQCREWKMKVVTLLLERERVRVGLEDVEGHTNCPSSVTNALALMRKNDVDWFPAA